MSIAGPARAARPGPRRYLGRWLRVGVLANLVLLVAVATAWAYGVPLFSGGDEMAHLDHAWQIWQGRWPVFEAGLQLNPPFGVRAPVQWTSQHPPLYYLIQAPFVGPWLDAGNVLVAGYVGRAVNTVIGAALVGAAMWTASAIAPARNALMLVTGTVTALYPVVVETAGTMYSDLLLALWATLLIGLTARMMHRGASARRLVLFTLVACAALLSRSGGAPVLLACAVALAVAFVVRRHRSAAFDGWRGVAGVAVAVVVAVASSAWFYLRNLALTGNLVGGRFDYLVHRVRRPLSEVVTVGDVWQQLLAIHGYDLVNNVVASILLVAVPLVAGVVVGLRRVLRQRRLVPEVALAALLTGLVAGILLMQLLYVGSGGGASMRYLAPITVIIAFGVAAGLTWSRRIAPLLVIAWSALAFIPSAAFVLSSLVAIPGPRSGPVFPVPTVGAVAVAGAALLVTIGVHFALAGYFDDVVRLPQASAQAPKRALTESRPGAARDGGGPGSPAAGPASPPPGSTPR